MANMKNIPLSKIIESGRAHTVGNNRTIEFHPKESVFVGRLHGHKIFEISQDMKTLCLDTCHYMTTTTRSAMNDFMAFFDVYGGVSFAKGKFTVTAYGQTVSRSDTHIITLSLND